MTLDELNAINPLLGQLVPDLRAEILQPCAIAPEGATSYVLGPELIDAVLDADGSGQTFWTLQLSEPGLFAAVVVQPGEVMTAVAAVADDVDGLSGWIDAHLPEQPAVQPAVESDAKRRLAITLT